MSQPWSPTHVAFLRSINVGGRRLKMDELVAECDGLSLGEIRTWQATGNLIFASELSGGELEQRIPVVLEQSLGIEVPCVVRTVSEVRAIADAAPFSESELASTARKVQALLVRDAPDGPTREAILEHATDADPLRFADGVLWWLPRVGVSDSSLKVRAIERLLGVCTMRTQGAVAKLAAHHLAVR